MNDLTGVIANLEVVTEVSNELSILSEISEDTIVIAEIADSVEIDVELTPSAEIQVSIVEGGPPGPPGPPGSIYPIPETYGADYIIETEEKQFISMADKLRISGYVHDQIKASKIWVINHTLNKCPSVSVVDTGGSIVIGEVVYISENQLTVTFTAMFSGKAYLN